MLKIRKRVKKIFFFKKKYIYLVGNYKINLPIDHPLKSYQNKYKNYILYFSCFSIGTFL